MDWKNVTMSPILILVFILGGSPQSKKRTEESPQAESAPGPVIMAYYVPERNFEPEKIPVEKLTHIIYSFTNVIDGEMKFRKPEIVGPKLEALVKQKERNPDLKVMIACGGWGADGFSDMAQTEEGRTKFIDSASEFIKNISSTVWIWTGSIREY